MLIDLQALKDYLLIAATLVGIIKSIFELGRMAGEMHFKKNYKFTMDTPWYTMDGKIP